MGVEYTKGRQVGDEVMEVKDRSGRAWSTFVKTLDSSLSEMGSCGRVLNTVGTWWELDHKEGWALKNWCFWIVVLEKMLETPLGYKEIKPINLKGNQSWIFIGRTDAEAPVLWPPDMKSWLIGKDPDAGKDWGQEEKWATEDQMLGWHHQLNEHEFEQVLRDSEGQRNLASCSLWCHKESDTT